MASKRKRSKAVPFSAAEIVTIAKSNPYIERLIEDPKLRKNVSTALASSKAAYERLNNGSVHPQKLLEDKKLHAELGRALGAARDVSIILVNTPRRRRRRRLTFGRAVLVAVIAMGVALGLSEGLRSKALDMLFGAEEEFQYTPPATSPAPDPTTPVGAS
jgi:hypothetical protein